MKRMALLMLSIALAGCNSRPVEELSYSEKKAIVDRMVARCVAQGVKMQTPEMTTCATVELDRELAIQRNNQVRADRARMAIAAGLQTYGQALQQNAANYNANRPVNCVSTPGLNGTYRTRCN